MNTPSYDDNELSILGKLPEDPTEDAKRIVDAPRIRTARDLLEVSVSRANSPVEVPSCTTGNYYLDQKTNGLKQGWFWLVGADTGAGKSSLAVAFADDNLAAGRGVLIVSLEDPEELYGDRLMLRRCLAKAKATNRAPVSADRLRLNKLTSDDKVLMMEVASEGERLPMFVDARDKKGEVIARDIGRMLDNIPIDLCIVDYLQEIHSESEHHSTRDKVTAMCRAIREEVRSRNRCLVITSQVTVDDPNKWPRRNQIRDSRDVVNAAEVVLMLGIANSDITEKNKRSGTERLIIPEGERGALVDKCKQGHKGFVRLPWNDEAACFESVQDPDDARMAESVSAGESWYETDNDITDGYLP